MCTNRRVLSLAALLLVVTIGAGCSLFGSGGPDVDQIVFNPSSLEFLGKGQNGSVQAIAVTVDGARRTDLPVTWSSSDESVISILADGRIRGVAAGEATVTATVEGTSRDLTLEVVDMTGEWVGLISPAPGVPADSIVYDLQHTDTGVAGTYRSKLGFPPITDNGTGPLTGSLTWNLYRHRKEVKGLGTCTLIIEGSHRLDRDEDGLVLRPPNDSVLSGEGCNLAGQIIEPVLRRGG